MMQDISGSLYSENNWAAPFQRCSTRPPRYQYPMDQFVKTSAGCAWNITKDGKPWCQPRIFYFLNREGNLEDTAVCYIIFNSMIDFEYLVCENI